MYQVEVFIFSFNRGRFLLNCVNSARKYLPNAKIIVIDDNSTESETLRILKLLSKKISILNPKKSENSRWGGFYRNINWVIQELSTDNWAILIEDDMQFIRPLIDTDIIKINSFFNKFPKSGYLAVEFLREQYRNKDKETVKVDRNNNIYFFSERAVEYRGTIHLSSTGILNVKYMREIGYKFEGARPEVRKRAQQLFTPMGIYPYPILMYLPFAPTLKNKKGTMVRKLVEKIYHTGFYPYQEMTEEKLNRFLTRDISILPYTSDWLKTSVHSPGRPFEYADSMKRTNRFIRRLELIELKIRRILS